MKNVDPSALSIEQLVERFAAICLEQDRALRMGGIAEFNRLYDDRERVEEELKLRPGDQRRALMALYRHSNAQVRLTAAKSTLAVAPAAARELLQAIADSKKYPQAGDAGMCLWNLDRGFFKPT